MDAIQHKKEGNLSIPPVGHEGRGMRAASG